MKMIKQLIEFVKGQFLFGFYLGMAKLSATDNKKSSVPTVKKERRW